MILLVGWLFMLLTLDTAAPRGTWKNQGAAKLGRINVMLGNLVELYFNDSFTGSIASDSWTN